MVRSAESLPTVEKREIIRETIRPMIPVFLMFVVVVVEWIMRARAR